MENYIAIGDIHGRNDLLTKLLENEEVSGLVNSGSHKLVFLGDMVDRGPDSWLVVEKIRDMVRNEQAIALLGNHEDMMLEFHRKKIADRNSLWMYNGGHKTVDSYGKAMRLYGLGHWFEAFEKSGHAQFVKSLPYFYETEKVWFSHAPIPCEYALKTFPQFFGKSKDFRMDPELLTWTCVERVDEGTWEHHHGKISVCGHVHRLFFNETAPRIFPHIIYADTGSGCAPHAPLTAIVINDGKYGKFVQARP